MDFLYLLFYGCLRLWFLDVETNPSPHRPVPVVCRILCTNTLQNTTDYAKLTLKVSIPTSMREE